VDMLQDEIVSCVGNYFIMGSLTLNSLSGLCFEWVLVVKIGWSGLCFNGLYQCISSQNVGGLKVVCTQWPLRIKCNLFKDDYLCFGYYYIMFLLSCLIVGKYGQTQQYFCAFGM
jgi:hypothetical protein